MNQGSILNQNTRQLESWLDLKSPPPPVKPKTLKPQSCREEGIDEPRDSKWN